MKLSLNMIMKLEDVSEEKFMSVAKAYPELHLDLLRVLAQSIMLAFRFDKSDNVSIESFRLGKIEETVPVEVAPIEKKEIEN